MNTVTDTEHTSATESTVAPGDRAAFLQAEAEALIAYFDGRPLDAEVAVTVMAIVQTRVCASLGPDRDQSFASLQEMVAGLYEASKHDFDAKPTEPAAAPAT